MYSIAPDGSPKKIWSSHDDIVYALAFDSAGKLIAGTGNKGRIYAIEKNGIFDAQAVSALVNKFRAGRASSVKDDMALVGVLSTQVLATQFTNPWEMLSEKCIQQTSSVKSEAFS